MSNRRTMANALFAQAVRTFENVVRLAGRKAYWKLMPRLLEELDVVYTVRAEPRDIKIYCGGEVARYRAETYFTKEPDTIRWINGFGPNDVLLDVGANIGIYTIYAAVVRQARVIAIEPSAANFGNLARNIRLNNVGELVYPICAAAHETTGVSKIFLHSGGLVAGGSGAVFSQSGLDNDEQIVVADVHHMIGLSLDDLVDIPGVPFPTHLKLDILGTQDKVIRGAKRLLADPRLKSAMIEIPEADLPKTAVIREAMATAGMREIEVDNPSEMNHFYVRD